jgi:hypothetical protein
MLLILTDFSTLRNPITRNDEQLRNKIYKYDWNGQSLIDSTVILDLPAITRDGGESRVSFSQLRSRYCKYSSTAFFA